MVSKPIESEEYKCFVEFTESDTYKKLTQGDDAVFKGFDSNDVEDLREMRDYIRHQAHLYTDVENTQSPILTKLQIGAALPAFYKAEEERKRESHSLHHHRRHIVTKNSYAPLLKIRA